MAEPISPELVLVAPPDEAERARASLPLPGPPVSRFPEVPSSPVVRRSDRRRCRVVLAAAGIALLAGSAAAAALLVVRDRGVDSDKTGAKEPAPSRTVAPKRAQPHAHGAAKQALTAKPAHTKALRPARKSAQPHVATHKRATRPRSNHGARAAPARHFVPAHTFAWPAKQGAAGYLVRFFRGSTVVFAKRTSNERVTLPRTFHFVPGNYRWLVIPLDKKGRRGAPIVASHFIVAAKS
jgi:hypothetical protein